MNKIEMNLQDTNENSVASIGGTGFGNTSAYKLNDFLVIIDTSMYKKTSQKFKEHVENKFSSSISHVIYTHYHGDHTFGSEPFKSATVISSEETSLNLNKDYSDDWKKSLEDEDPLVTETIEILQPKNTFDEFYTISNGRLDLEIRKLGGHTSGSSIIYSPSDKILYAGDLIFNQTFPYGGDPTCDLDGWIEALNIIKSYDCKMILPGHGPLIENKNEIAPHIKFFKNVKSILIEGIEDDNSPETIEAAIEIPDIFQDAADRRKGVSFEQWYEAYKSNYSVGL